MEWSEGGRGRGTHSPGLVVAQVRSCALTVVCEPWWLFWLVVVHVHCGSWLVSDGEGCSSPFWGSQWWGVFVAGWSSPLVGSGWSSCLLSPVLVHGHWASLVGGGGWLWLSLTGGGPFLGGCRPFCGQSVSSRSNDIARLLMCHVVGRVLAWLVMWQPHRCRPGWWWL